MSLISDLKERKIYIKSIQEKIDIYGNDSDVFNLENNEYGIGYYMRMLKINDSNPSQIKKYLNKLSKILYDNKEEQEKFKKEYYIYKQLLYEQKDITKNKNIRILDSDTYLYHWGSIKQFKCGKCIIDAININNNFNIHYIWGCLLYPSGGLSGTDNNEVLDFNWKHPISLHSIIHDASGYIYKYHNIGNSGYNYLNTCWTLYPKTHPLCCQYYGINWWTKQTGNSKICTFFQMVFGLSKNLF